VKFAGIKNRGTVNTSKRPKVLSKFICLPTDAQLNFKIYIKIDIETAPTCFGAVTPSSGSALSVLAKVTVVNIATQNISACGDVAAYVIRSLSVCVVLSLMMVITQKHVGAVLMSILM